MRCINLPLTLTVTLRCCLAGRMRLADRSGRLCRRMSACVARLPGHLPCRRPLFPGRLLCRRLLFSGHLLCRRPLFIPHHQLPRVARRTGHD